MRKLVILAMLIALLPARVEAQIPLLDGVFKSVQDVNTGFGFSSIIGPSPLSRHGLTSVGFEITLLVGSFGCRDLPPTTGALRDAGGRDRDEDLCKMKKEANTVERALRWRCLYDSLDQTLHPPAPHAPTAAIDSTCRHPSGGNSSTAAGNRAKPSQGDSSTVAVDAAVNRDTSGTTDAPWDAEIGLSYERLSGFGLADSGFRMVGAVDETPIVAAYLNYDGFKNIGFYGGAKAGIAKLADVQATKDSAHTWIASGTTVMYGFVLGGDWKIDDKIFLYLEGSLSFRRFPALAWTPPSGASFVPTALPRTLRMNTEDLSLGVQLNLK